MFESAELGHHIDKRRYRRELPKLRAALLDAQYELKERADFPVIIVLGGVNGAGRSETMNALHAWMDPRLLAAHAFGPPSREERALPRLYRYWQALPPKGRIGVFFGSWYTEPLEARVLGDLPKHVFVRALEDIVRFERMLVDEGALLLKFWMHLSKAREKKRLEALEDNPHTRWRVTRADWEGFARYDRLRTWGERTVRKTSQAGAPWLVVEGQDPEYRELTVGRALLQALRSRLDHPGPLSAPPQVPALPPPIDGVRRLASLDLSGHIAKADYSDELARWQGKLAKLTRHSRFRKRSLVVVFEGPDAAGKGGAIRRITAALDARIYRVHPVSAPSEEERAQPFLWRFWRHLPGRGQVAIFDRSWYGRVLVERVAGLGAAGDHARAYAEINDFEAQLVDSGALVVKFWLAISKEEQLRRFHERERLSFKHYKITPEDYRNRDRWEDYELAADEMFERTSTDIAPWVLVEAEDKHVARLKILKTLVHALERD
jgi:polyphosphate:AMP phosphotransferase